MALLDYSWYFETNFKIFELQQFSNYSSMNQKMKKLYNLLDLKRTQNNVIFDSHCDFLDQISEKNCPPRFVWKEIFNKVDHVHLV